jgi:hypothetical protein
MATGTTRKRSRTAVARERERIQRKRRLLDTQVSQVFKTVLPGVSLAEASLKGILRGLAATMSMPMSASVRRAVRERLVKALAGEFVTLKIKYADLGAANPGELAETFVRMLERAKFDDYSVSRLRSQAAGVYSRKPGLRSVFAGELFELLARNLRELQDDLKAMAQAQLDDLNDVVAGKVRSRRPKLLDGNGDPITLKGTFGPIRRVNDVVTIQGNQRPKFVDFGYVSVFTPAGGGPRMLVFLVESELKLPGAAAGLSEQIGSALGRFANSDGVEVVFEGAQSPTRFNREQLIVDPTTMNRTGIAPTQRETPTYRWRTTERGGYKESYLRIGVTIQVDELYRLVNLLFRK